MSKKALILVDKNPQTSFGRIARDFHQALTLPNWESHIFWLASKQYFPEASPDLNWTAYSKSFLGGFFLWRKPLLQKIAIYKPHWILISRPELGFLVPVIQKKFPQIKISVMIHDTFAMTLYPNSIKFKLINRFYINPLWKANGIIYNSLWTQNEVQKLHPKQTQMLPQKITGCVIDPQEFKTPKQSVEELRNKWKIPLSKRVFFNLSLDEPRKNIHTFFKLAKKLPNDLFIRRGSLSKWMSDFLESQQIKNVQHIPPLSLEELCEYYSLADVFILPSYLEGFGYPAFESLSCGTKVISSGTSALQENLEGIVPLINPPDSVELYLEALQNLKNFPNPTSKKVQKVLQQFSPEEFQKRLLDHWEELNAK